MQGMIEHVIERTGASYRQLDYWSRCGYLRLPSKRAGRRVQSGVARVWPPEEIEVARMMVRLLAVGLSARESVRLSREYVERLESEEGEVVEIKLAKGIVIRLREIPDEPAPPSEIVMPRIPRAAKPEGTL